MKKEENRNIMSDNYYVSGVEFSTAVHEFRRMEKATHTVKVDLSIVCAMSVISDSGILRPAVLLDGDDDMMVVKGYDLCWKDAMYVNIRAKEGMEGKGLYFQIGGACQTPIDVSDPYLIFIGEMAMPSLTRHLRIPNYRKGFFRDATIGTCCSRIEDEDTVEFLYREANGIKKAFYCYSKAGAAECLRFDDLWNTARKSIKGIKVTKWEISQESRKVWFEGKNGNAFSVEWSDTAKIAPSVTFGGKLYKFKSKEDLGHIFTNIREGRQDDILMKIPCKVLEEERSVESRKRRTA